MSDDGKCYAATPAATLEEHILNPNIAKSDTEWWAHREITRLRAENERLRNVRDEQFYAHLQCVEELRKELVQELAAVTAERDRMREALKPFSERMKELEKCKNSAKYGVSTDIDIEHLRRAKEVYENTK